MSPKIPTLAVLLAFTAIWPACTSTVTPKPVIATEPSWDGNALNSGVITVASAGYTVTSHFRDRYNAMVETYGHDFKPAIKKDDGMTSLGDGTWLFDRQHMNQFLQMNAWLRSGLKPQNP